MAQRIYWQYKDEDSTYDLNVRQTGIIPFGRYKGFDPVPDGMSITLKRNTTHATRVELDLSTALIGVWVTRQGAVVVEDGDINLPLSDGDATHPRIDIIVGTHNHVESAGGIAATYSIVEGTPAADPVAPGVLDETTDVILGYLTIPAGATEVLEEMYTYARIPDFADDATLPHLDKIQKFSATQFMHSMYMDVCFGSYRPSDSSLHLGIAGSFFSAAFPANQDGEYYVVDGTTTGTLPTGYVPVEAITFPKPRTYNLIDPPKAQRKVVVASFPVELIPSNYLTLPNDCPVRIESNEPFILEQVLGNSDLFGAPSDYIWYLVSGGQVNKGGVNKVTGLISHAYETATVNTGDKSIPRSEAQPRNIIRLANAGGIFHQVEFIQSQQYTQDGGAESGTTLTIHPADGDIILVLTETATSSTPPLGYKPIRNPSGGNVRVDSGPLVVQEMDDHFLILGGANLQGEGFSLTTGIFNISGGGRRNPDGFIDFFGYGSISPLSTVSANSGSTVFTLPSTQDPFGKPIYKIDTGSWWAVMEEHNGGGLTAVHHVRLTTANGYDVIMDYHTALSSARTYFLRLANMRLRCSNTP
jgi:hypothetical protein